MRTFLSLFCFFTLTLAAPVGAQDNTQEQAARKMAAALATDTGANTIMAIILGVEKSVGKSIGPKLALQVAECSELASHPFDPGKFGDGIDYAKIKAVDAIRECELAYDNGGDKIGLVLASLSRAYNKAKKYDRSLSFAREAVAVGYPFGDIIVAQHYHYGDGIKKDKAEQFRWFKKAAEKGVNAGMRTTAKNYTNGNGTAVNYDQAYFWSLQAIKQNGSS